MLNKNKKLESGRSMVEMLGVLAIIGVLSVGGIAGYTMAMNKYKANEIVNAVSMTYMLGMSANKGQGGNMSYDSVGTMPTGAESINFTATDKKVTVNITEPGVCDQVKNQLGDKAEGECSALKVTLGEAGTEEGGGTCDAEHFANCDETACGKLGNDFFWITSAGSNPTSFCAKYVTTNGPFDWCGARDVCGGINHMVSLSDLNCSTGSCGATGISGKSFFAADCLGGTCPGESCDENHRPAYGVANGYVDDTYTYRNTMAGAVCK